MLEVNKKTIAIREAFGYLIFYYIHIYDIYSVIEKNTYFKNIRINRNTEKSKWWEIFSFVFLKLAKQFEVHFYLSSRNSF